LTDALVALSEGVCRTSLTRLHLQRQELNDLPAIVAISNFVQLKTLALPSCRISHYFVLSLCRVLLKMQDLRSLDLSGLYLDTECSNNVLQSIQELPQLSDLAFGNNYVRPIDLFNFLQSHRTILRILDVNGGTIERIPEVLVNMPQMPCLLVARFLPDVSSRSDSDNGMEIHLKGLSVLQRQAPCLRELTLMAPDNLTDLDVWANTLAGFKALETLNVRLPRCFNLYDLYDQAFALIQETLTRVCPYVVVSVW